MAYKFQTLQGYNEDLDRLIEELLLALFSCKDAQKEELQLRYAGESLGDYITVPGGSGGANLFGWGASALTEKKNYWTGNKLDDPDDPNDTNF